MVLLQALSLGLIALIITPGLLFYFDVTPKLSLLLAASACLLACAALRPKLARPPKLWTALLSLTALSLAVSTAFSTNPAFSLIGTTWRALGLIPQLAMLVFGWFLASADRRTILRAIAFASALAAMYGIAQYFGVDPFLPASAYHIGEGIWTIVRPPGTLGYVTYFATWLVVAAFLCLALADVETNRALVWAARLAATLCAIAMLLTGTRADMLALAAGGLLWLAMSGFRLPRRAPLWIALAAVVAVAFYFSPAGWNLRSRARWFIEDPSGGGRPLLWRDSLRMSIARPLAGFGPEVFTAEFPRFESAALASKLPDFEYESPHNMFLDALTAQGIPGFLLLAAVCVYGFKSANRTRNSDTRWIAAALAAALVSQQFSVFVLPTALLFYATVALLVPREGPLTTTSSLMRVLLLAPAAALIFCAVRVTAADAQLAKTHSAILAHDPAAASLSYDSYRRLRLPGPAAGLWYSRSMLNLSQLPLAPRPKVEALAQAYAAAVRAPQTSDDPANAWYNLALFEAARSDSPATEAALRHAIAARPNWFKPHWTLSRLLQLQGRAADAQSEMSIAVSLDAGKHPLHE